MTRRQALALKSPCGRAWDTLSPAFRETVAGFSTILTVNR